MTAIKLTYIPIPNSHHVYLNGLELREGTDWSDDGTGLITFLTPADVRSADLVEVLYAHRGLVVPYVPPVPLTEDHTAANTSSLVVTLAGGAPAAGTVCVLTGHITTGLFALPSPIASVTGLGATWTRLARGVTGGEAEEVWVGVASGSGSTVTVSPGYTADVGAAVLQFSGTPATAAETQSSASSSTLGPVIGSGVAIVAYNGDDSWTDSGVWTTITVGGSSVGQPRAAWAILAPGDTGQRVGGIGHTYAMVRLG